MIFDRAYRQRARRSSQPAHKKWQWRPGSGAGMEGGWGGAEQNTIIFLQCIHNSTDSNTILKGATVFIFIYDLYGINKHKFFLVLRIRDPGSFCLDPRSYFIKFKNVE
jgi:hypothetical protein